MAVLIVNCGSSSLKTSLFLPDCRVNSSIPLPELFSQIDLDIRAIGHRVVHGGPHFTATTRIDDTVLDTLKSLSSLAPLHNLPALEAIEVCRAHFGTSIPQFAVFDTAFHSTMPEVARLYALPYSLTKRHSLYRYGFHGIAHATLWKLYSKERPDKKIITIHLGAGCSLAAIDNGVSLDTTMGFSPCEGLVMATRSGDIDPIIAFFLGEQEKLSRQQTSDLFNFRSGLLGLSEYSSDMQTLLASYDKNDGARRAVDLFCYRIQKYIGAYMQVLGGADAIVFSGGIGEHAPEIRKRIIEALSWLGVELDEEQNQETNKAPLHTISTEDSSVEVLVAQCDENEYMFEQVVERL